MSGAQQRGRPRRNLIRIGAICLSPGCLPTPAFAQRRKGSRTPLVHHTEQTAKERAASRLLLLPPLPLGRDWREICSWPALKLALAQVKDSENDPRVVLLLVMQAARWALLGTALAECLMSTPRSYAFAPAGRGGTPAAVGVPMRNSRKSPCARPCGVLALRAAALRAAAAPYAAYRESMPDGAWTEHEPLIDVRSASQFERRHLRWATSIPLEELQRRMFELPPPYESSVSLYGSQADMQAASILLEKYGWNVTRLVDCSRASEEREEEGILSRPVWRPSAFLEEVLTMPQVRQWAHASPSGDSSASTDGVRHALDIGCGAGRDMVLMARLLGTSWKVTGFDNDAGARERAEALAQLEAVSKQIQTVDVNLRKERFSQSAHLVHGCRFLDRRLLPKIRDEILEPNGLFIWSTFLQGNPRVRNGRSLEPGELRRLFVDDLPSHESFQVFTSSQQRYCIFICTCARRARVSSCVP